MGFAGMPTGPQGGFGLPSSREGASGVGFRRLAWSILDGARRSHQGA